MCVVAVFRDKIECFTDIESIEHEHDYYYQIGNESGVRAEQILVFPD